MMKFLGYLITWICLMGLVGLALEHVPGPIYNALVILCVVITFFWILQWFAYGCAKLFSKEKQTR